LTRVEERVLKNILVIGGAGYIGSHTCKTLHAAGFVPVVLDNLSKGNKWAVKWGPLIEGDIKDSQFLCQTLDNVKPVAVMHFAAHAYVGESVQHPQKYYQNNVAGTLNILDAMLAHNIRNFIFSSTCATYGVPEFLPITELHPQAPINPYGTSKLMVEQILRDYDNAYNLKHVSLRYFNAAGADPDSEIGENHDPETHLIPLVLDVAMGKRASLSVFGNDYDTSDGTCIRDYIHVSDLATAHVLSLKYLLEEDSSSAAFNLGNGKGFSVNEIITTAERVTGKKIQSFLNPRRPGDPPVLIGDASKFVATMAWKPHYSEIDTIIETAYKWQRKFKD